MGNIPDEVMIWIALSQEGRLSSEEKSGLIKWLDEHPEAGEEAEDIARLIEKAELAGIFHTIDVDKAWQKVEGKTPPMAGWIRRRRIGYWRAVAAVILPVAIAASVLLYREGKEDLLTVAHEEVIRPGKAQAELWLASGEKIALKQDRQQQIVDRDGQVMGVDSSHTFVCQAAQLQTEAWNTLKVPVGGEYQLILSDKTKIWVNAGSEVRFPVKFQGKEREVYLRGEAYFQVSPDHEHPFIVRTACSRIQVLGTSFNVSCYEEEKERTTLVEGKVEVILPDRVYTLQPGKQLELNTQDRSVTLKDVDVALYTSWKDQRIIFIDDLLDEVLRKLERWYNVQFFIQDESIRTFRFTGNLPKYEMLSKVLEKLELTTSIYFVQQGHTVIVRKE